MLNSVEYQANTVHISDNGPAPDQTDPGEKEGRWSINVFQPKSLSTTIGCIYNVPLDIDEHDLKEILEKQQDNDQIVWIFGLTASLLAFAMWEIIKFIKKRKKKTYRRQQTRQLAFSERMAVMRGCHGKVKSSIEVHSNDDDDSFGSCQDVDSSRRVVRIFNALLNEEPQGQVIQPIGQPQGQPNQPQEQPQPVQPPGQPNQPQGQPIQPPGQPNQPQGQPIQPPGQPNQPQGQPIQPPEHLNQPQGQPMQPPGQPNQPQGQPIQPVGQPNEPQQQPRRSQRIRNRVDRLNL
ncbi:unnamed protein product [Mytilus coruscus]|uniref:Uncharacterized protein n=1 Tax=Mytilus coruscus TaxID=42192 RepID=A0A6J8B1U5_MYTCO|nr:unnamed protein product [Mytilus coruscus]